MTVHFPSWFLFVLAVVSLGPVPAAADVQKAARGAYPDLAIDGDGGVHLVYVRAGQLQYRHRPAGSDQWSPEQATGVPQGQVNRSDPEIVIDSKGQPHVFVGSTYAVRRPSGWESLTVDAGRDTCLAIDSQDNLYLVRRGGHGRGYLGLLVKGAASQAFEPLPDPDVADGLPIGRNDHVYAHMAVRPADDSLHVVYRHGNPQHFAYRTSSDGGRHWKGAGISNDDAEAPSITIGADGAIYAISGTGEVFRRGAAPENWTSLGRGIQCGDRDLPVLAADASGRIVAASFGGRINVYRNGRWRRETTLPRLSGKPLGFVALACPRDGRTILAAWEEGDDVNHAQTTQEFAGESDILVARIDRDLLRAARAASDVSTPQTADDSPPPSEQGAPDRVGLWSRFEASVRNTKNYADPFRDVTLNVSYTKPSGGEVKFWGFYDGRRTWKLRYMPDEPGTWTYRATFSDGSPGVEGSFTCVPSDLPGMISRDERNPLWFGFRGGEGTLIRALHVGDRFFAENWPEDQRIRFLDWAQQQGYNLLSIGSHYLNRDEPGRGRSWETPDLWPLNPAAYRRMERIMDELARRRIMIFPFAGFFGRGSDFPRDSQDQDLYVRYTLARIGCYWNVLLNVGGPEPYLKGKPYLTQTEIDELGRLIADRDVFRHLLTVHNATGDDLFKNADWLSFGTLQGPKTNELDELSRGLLRNHHAQKPLLAQETLWSGNVNHIRRLGRDYSDDELRRNAWVIHCSAAALVFADNGGGNSSAGFSGSLDPTEAAQHRHDIIKGVWDLAAQFPFQEMSPHPELVDTGFCLAKPGEYYFVFLPAQDEVNVRIEGGPYRVEWIDAREGTERHHGGSTSDGNGLRPPSSDGDWLLWLTRQP